MQTRRGTPQEGPALRIRLLGELELRRGGAPLRPLDSARAESLLAYLLLHREAPQARQRVAFLLWPDSTEPQARTNLRHVLHTLRRALPDADELLEVTPRTLQWRPAAPAWLDVAAFEDALARAAGGGENGEVAALREAVDLYAGDLLEGVYDEWLLEERERLRTRRIEALERLAGLLETRGEHAAAIPYAERLLRADPLREETHRRLMRLHDARGDRARALRAYHACAATLEQELGIEPSAPTRALYEALLPHEPATLARVAGELGGRPLIGRRAERARLVELWHAAQRGQAQLVLVTGEPGIGKTRLVDELRSWCAHRGAVTAHARSHSAEGALAFGPVAAWLRSEPLAARRGRLNRGRLAELARLLPELSGATGLPRAEPLPESEQRRRLFDAAVGAILATDAPLLLVADDAHWADRDTLQFVHYLIRSEPEARLLVAATARPEDLDLDHPLNELVTGLRGIDRLAELELERLSREETAVLAERSAGRALAGPDSDRLFAETEGNPLFVVEALRAGWDGGGGEAGPISPKVQAVIESRLAQLSPAARDLVGLAATIGREFTADLLAAASETGPEALVGPLDELWRRRLLREGGGDSYDFTHDKIREAAHLALSPARRRRHHLQVARALAGLHPHDLEPVSAQLASHFERAGRPDEAIPHYALAAGAAQRVHANHDAIRLLDRGLDLLATLPRTPERDGLELRLLLALLVPVAAAQGTASARLTEVQERALALSGEPAPPLLRSIAITSLSRGRLEEAERAGRRLQARGEGDADELLLVEGHYVLGVSAFWRAELTAAEEHFRAAVRRYRPEHRPTHLARYGLDPSVVCQSRLSNTLWFLGDPPAAVSARDEALALAQETGHPLSHATALTFAALLALELRDDDGVRRHGEALGAWRAQHTSKVIEVTAEALAGYVEVLDGDAAAGLARLHRAHEALGGAEHAPGHRACVVRVLLEACAVAGDARAGLAVADAPLGMGAGARLWAPETHRLRAEFMAALGSPQAAVEAELARALEIARRQGSRSLELRSAASLRRHRREPGDGDAEALLPRR